MYYNYKTIMHIGVCSEMHITHTYVGIDTYITLLGNTHVNL